MRAGRRKRSLTTERITLNLASMIDVIFLLLIYFMVTTVLARPEDRLSPTLQTRQESQAGPSSDFQPQIVEVRRGANGPEYRLGTRVIPTRQELEQVLVGLPKEAGVFIQVHDQVPVGFAVAAVQISRDVGFEKVTYVPAD
ncbi:MAG: ExbD/TolR family protein [Planctomycetota bacterium]|jgi:biopolymer transport protein ExbD